MSETNPQYDYLVVGQGITGTVLAFSMLERGLKVLVIDRVDRKLSSWVALGAFNPLTGRRLVKTWLADQAFPAAHEFYSRMERALKTRFFYPMPIYRPFPSVELQNDWLSRAAEPDVSPYVIEESQPNRNPALQDPLGGLLIGKGGFADPTAMMLAFREYLRGYKAIIDVQFNFDDLSTHAHEVRWKGYTAKRIVFCEGVAATGNPFFNWLPFHPAKGELLTLQADGVPQDRISNKGVALVPRHGGMFRVGSNYDHKNLNYAPTKKGRQFLEGRLGRLLNAPYHVSRHEASIRPATRDRRPFIGLHPRHERVAIFNGFGSKAVSLAPYLAERLLDFLELGKPLPLSADVKRHYGLAQ